jgi:hypothetical protein
MIVKSKILSKKDKTYIISTFGIFLLFIFFTYIHIYLFPNFSSDISFDSGIYSESFEVEIINKIPHSDIKYTLDGSEPTIKSNSYTSPIKISETSVLRIINFRNNKRIGTEKIASYIISKKTNSLPIVKIIINDEDFNSPISGIYNEINSKKRGDKWKREAHFAFYDSNKVIPNFISKGEIRIFGDKSREFPRKSFNVCFENKVDFKFFYENALVPHKCLTLRNSGNDWNSTFFKDAYVHHIVSLNSNIHTQSYQPTILYVNNKYFGIYNIREYINNDLLSLKYGGNPSDYAILFPERTQDGKVSIESGTKSDAKLYYELLNQSKAIDNYYTPLFIEENMDVDNFIDYYIFQSYIENFDFIGSNLKVFRYNGFIKQPNSNRDGRFRWLIYDTDGGFGSLTKYSDIFNALEGDTDPSKRKWPFIIYNGILNNFEFRERYINRFTYLLNTGLRPEFLNSKIDEFANRIEHEVPFHIERWIDYPYHDKEKRVTIKPLSSIEDWRKEVDKMKEYNIKRHSEVYLELDKYFKLGGVYELNILNQNPEGGYIVINNLKITDSMWKGKYFKYQHLNITPVPYVGYEVYNFEEINYNNFSVNFKKVN